MRIIYNNKYKIWTVTTNHTNKIVFSHEDRKTCYEWIFAKVSYA